MHKSLTITILLGATIAWSQATPASPPKPKPKTPVKVRKDRPAKKVVTVLSGFDLLSKNAAYKETTVAGATRGAAPVALAPSLGRVYSPNPVLRWFHQDEKGHFRLTLTDDGSNDLFTGETDGTSFQYPETAPKLEPGKTYFWTVEPVGPLSETSQKVGFVVLSDAQRAKIGADLSKSASDRDRAEIFTKYRIWYDTIDAYDRAIQSEPRSAELLEKRGTVLAQLEVTRKLGLKDLAAAAEIRSQRH